MLKINGLHVEFNPNSIHCLDCEFFKVSISDVKCKLNKKNPFTRANAIEALSEGKLCEKGYWRQKTERR